MGEGCLQAAALVPFLGRGHLSETYMMRRGSHRKIWGKSESLGTSG